MEISDKVFLMRLHHLYDLANRDEIFKIWERMFTDNEKKFEKFASRMPKRIRDMLYNYADGGRMMMQRLSNIACLYMDFTEDSLICDPLTEEEKKAAGNSVCTGKTEKAVKNTCFVRRYEKKEHIVK